MKQKNLRLIRKNQLRHYIKQELKYYKKLDRIASGGGTSTDFPIGSHIPCPVCFKLFQKECDPGRDTTGELNSWGAAHGPLWDAIRAQGRRVEVIAIGAALDAVLRADRLLQLWATAEPGKVIEGLKPSRCCSSPAPAPDFVWGTWENEPCSDNAASWFRSVKPSAACPAR